jgi:hypothetical protein
MRKIFIIAALAAFAVGTGGTSIASAQGRGGGHGGAVGGGPPSFTSGSGSNQGTQLRGLDRADAAAGAHGKEGRKIARKHGANKSGFCPPGQAKNPVWAAASSAETAGAGNPLSQR